MKKDLNVIVRKNLYFFGKDSCLILSYIFFIDISVGYHKYMLCSVKYKCKRESVCKRTQERIYRVNDEERKKNEKTSIK